jgi:hypothetical protein
MNGSDVIYFDGIRFISAASAAKEFGFVRDYLARLCRQGFVRGRQVGRKWYIDYRALQTFVIEQEHRKELAREELRRESRAERTAAQAAPPQRSRNAPATRATNDPSSGLQHLVMTAPPGGFEPLAHAAIARSHPLAQVPLAHVLAHTPVYALSPLAEFVHKVIALSLAFLLVFGTYAIVDPQYSRFAANSISGNLQSLAQSYGTGTSGVQTFAVAARTQLAAAAENPGQTLALATYILTNALPRTLSSLARTLNTRVNTWVYAVAFPASLTTSQGSVAVDIQPYAIATKSGNRAEPNTVSAATTTSQPNTALASNTTSRTSNGSTPLTTSNPVIERTVETQRIVVAGGITEDELTQKLNALDDKLSSRVYASAAANSTVTAQNYAVTAQTNAIGQLDHTKITSPTITGGSLAGVDVSANSLSVSGTTNLGTSNLGDTTIGGNLSLSSTSSSITASNAVITNATSTDLFSVLGTFTTGVIDTLTATIANITNLTATNLIATNATTTNATSTNLFASNLTATNGTLVNATTTNLFSTTASSTNLFASSASFGTLLMLSSTTLQNFTGVNATTTNLAVLGGTNLATTTIAGGLTLSGSPTSQSLTTSGDATIGGNLTVNGNSITLGTSTSNSLIVNSSIRSNLVPDQNKTYDLGSPSYYWRNGYIDTLTVNNISAASTSIGGTASKTFTLDSGNNTSDADNMSLIFFRGTVVPNALLSWNAAGNAKRFEFNQPLYIQNQSGSTTIPTLSLQGLSGQTANIFQVASSSGASLFHIAADGSTNIGGSLTVNGPLTTTQQASTTLFSSLGPAYFGSTATTTIDSAGNIAVAGTLNVTGSTQLASLTASGNTTLANATTTTLFSMTASSTNLFSQTASLGSLSLGSALTIGSGGTGVATLTGLVKGNGTSAFTAAVAGTDYENPLAFGSGLTRSVNTVTLDTSGSWSGTLGGYTPAQLIAAGFSTTSAAYWKTQNNFFATTSSDYWLTTKSTSNLAEGTNLYFTNNRVASVIAGTTTDALAQGTTNKYYSSLLFASDLAGTSTDALHEGGTNQYFTTNRVASVVAGTTTDALAQGATNKYWSNTLFDNRLSATTSLPNITTLANLASVGTITSGTLSGLFGAVSGANLTNLTAANISAGIAGINVTGNAGTATALQTARNINSVSFNGTSDITISAASSTLLSDNNTLSGIDSFTNASSNFAGTLGGYTPAQLIAAGFSTTSAAYWKTQNNFFATSSSDYWLTTKSTSNLAEGSNLYFTNNRVASVIAGTTTDALMQGSINRYYSTSFFATDFAATSTSALAEGTNKYYTDARVASYINSSSTVPHIGGSAYGDILYWTGNSWGHMATSTLGIASGGGSPSWGTITGTLSNQTDLQNALDTKLALSSWYATTTNGLAEGVTNKYYTDARVDNRINATTSIGTLTSAPSLSLVSTSLSGFLKATAGALTTALVDLTSNVTGVLPVGNGGTGISSPSTAGVLLGSYSGTGYQQIATSSLGLLTTNVAEGSNLYFTNNRVAGAIAGTTTDALTQGTTNKYYSTRLFATDLAGTTTTALTEGSNLYFTNARSIGSTLTGYVSGAGAILSSDSILSSIQKLNGNIAGLVTGVSSVFGRTGVVTAQSGDYNTSQVTESGNLYFTNARAQNAISVTGSPLTYASGVIGLNQANGSQAGFLSSTDWTTFNSRLASSSLSAGTGVGYNSATGVISNTGVTSNVAGTGISLSGGTGAVTIANTGVTNLSASYPLLTSGSTGGISISTAFSTTTTNTFSGANTFNGNTTLTNATSTNFFSTIASSTNLFATNGMFGVLSAGTLALSGTSGTTTIASGQGFTIGGSQFVLQQGSGNVGIGTTGPGGKLDVVDSTNGSGTYGLGNFAARFTSGKVYGGDPIFSNIQAGAMSAGHYVGGVSGNYGTGFYSYVPSGGHGWGASAAIFDRPEANVRMFFMGSASTTGILYAQQLVSTTTSATLFSLDNSGNGYYAGNVGIGTNSPVNTLDIFNNAAGTAGNAAFGLFAAPAIGSQTDAAFTLNGATSTYNPTGTFAMSASSIVSPVINAANQTVNLSGITFGNLATNKRDFFTANGSLLTLAGSPVFNDTSGAGGLAQNRLIANGISATISLTPVNTAGNANTFLTSAGTFTNSSSGTGFAAATSFGLKGTNSSTLNTGNGTAYGASFISTATASTTYGVYIAQGSSAASNTAYGLRLDGPATTNVNDYSLYSSGTAPSYFAGNVGIGTASPAVKLDVAGSAAPGTTGTEDEFHITRPNNNGVSWPQVTSFSLGSYSYDINHPNTRLDINLKAASNSTLTGDTNVMSLLSNGNVGIGTASPNTLLSVNGTASFGTNTSIGSGFVSIVFNKNTYNGLTLQQTTNDTGGGDLLAFNNTSNSNIGSISSNASSVAYNTTSDRRLKENIATTTAGLDILLQIPVDNFDFISDPTHTQTQGFIAQDLEKIYPEAVTTNGDNGTVPLGATSTPWAVDYGRITPLLIKSVQDIATLSDTFKKTLVAWLGSATNGITDLFAGTVHAHKLCADDICVTRDQLAALLAGQAASAAASGGASSSSQSNDTSTTSDTPPVITINGDNPAYISVDATYNDLGATITGPQADLNLGINAFLNGTLTSNIVLDTSAAATDTIDYVATDTWGNTATSTREVIIDANPNVATTSPSNAGAIATSTPAAQ